jgi:hypothetical protein
VNKVRLQQRYLVKVARNIGVRTLHLAKKGYKNDRNHCDDERQSTSTITKNDGVTSLDL